MSNRTEHLHKAKRVKNDEFFRKITDIEKELSHYQDQLKGLWVYSPCDDYRWSNFPKYFVDNFHSLGISHYTCTNYDLGDGAYRYDYDGPMGVPTSFFKYQNELEDYEILEKRADLKINGKNLFQRLIIQKRK